MVNVHRPSPLQRRVLIVLAALDAKCPGPVATRDIERVLDCRWTLRSKLPELVRQELWDVLPTYNLVRYQMVRMAFELKGIICRIIELQRIDKRNNAATDNAVVAITGENVRRAADAV